MASGFLDAVGAWLVAAVIATLTVFSNKIVERIRLSLNRADLRTKQFEELALDLSSYVFFAELHYEFESKGWDVNQIIEDYNDAITTLRKKEFVYLSWVQKYWDQKALVAFEELMRRVRAVDDAVHAFNERQDFDRKTRALGKEVDLLRADVRTWLGSHYA